MGKLGWFINRNIATIYSRTTSHTAAAAFTTTSAPPLPRPIRSPPTTSKSNDSDKNGNKNVYIHYPT